jgi:hypothetical protein
MQKILGQKHVPKHQMIMVGAYLSTFMESGASCPSVKMCAINGQEIATFPNLWENVFN